MCTTEAKVELTWEKGPCRVRVSTFAYLLKAKERWKEKGGNEKKGITIAATETQMKKNQGKQNSS